MLKHLVLLVFGLVAAGCASGNSAFSGSQNVLPLPLPPGSFSPGIQTPPKGSSAAVEVIVYGSEFAFKNLTSNSSGNTLNLVQGGEQFAWAVYELPNVAANYEPTSLAIEVTQQGTEHYVALANYTLGEWEYMEPGAGNTNIPLGDFTDYASPTNSLYFAVIVQGAALSVERSIITVDDTRELPAPTGLTANPGNGSVLLSWDPYPDTRADEIWVFRSFDPEMAGPLLEATLDPGDVSYLSTGLDNGTTYFYALKAYWEDEPSVSNYSSFASGIPEETQPVSLSGMWPRAGNREDNRGCTTAIGPPSFATFVSIDLAPGRTTADNRTTPVIDSTGSVYALSGDAVLAKYSSDISTKYWDFKAEDHGSPGAKYLCPPHSPIVDSAGNIYFIAAPDKSPGAAPYVFSVRPDGGLNWKFDAVSISAEIDTPYPTPNIASDGNIIAIVNNKQLLVAIDQTGAEDWRYDFYEAREVHANPAITEGGRIEMPVYFSGIGIDPRQHWISLDELDGSMVSDFKGFGGPANYFSGLALPSGNHVYPEGIYLMLIDGDSGAFWDNIDMVEPLTSSPARSLDGSYIFESHPPYGFAGRGDMRCFFINTLGPQPTIELHFILQLNEGALTSQPSVDGNNTIFMPDANGYLYRIEFDQFQPIGDGNPSLTHTARLSETDTYHFNSFALVEQAAYIISEDNTLYCIWNAED